MLSNRVLAHTWPDKRATVLSMMSLGSRLFFALTAPLVGWATTKLTIPQALWVQAGLLAILFLGLTVAYARIPAKYHTVNAAPA